MDKVIAHESQPVIVSPRVWYVLCAFLFPIAVAGLISLLVFGSGSIERGPLAPTHSEFAKISQPIAGKRVKSRFDARGEVTRLKAGEVAYLAETVEGKYWPKTRLGSSTGAWQRKQVADGASGYKYTLVVLAVGPQGDQQLDDWFKHGRDTGKYPGIANIESMRALASIRIIKQ